MLLLIMLSVIVLYVIMLNVVLLSVIILCVVAQARDIKLFIQKSSTLKPLKGVQL